MKLCMCGCGNEVKKDTNNYIRFHQYRDKRIREKTSKSLQGIKRTEEFKEKCRNSAIGKPKSPEHIKKLSLIRKGKNYSELFGIKKGKIIRFKQSISSSRRLIDRVGKEKADLMKKAFIERSKKQKGKSWEEIYGKEGAQKRKENIRKRGNYRKDKTYEDLYGKEKALQLKSKLSSSHINNFTEELRQRLSKSHKGKKLSMQSRINASLARAPRKSFEGFLSPIRQLIETSEKYKLFKQQILKRDNYTCLHCGQHGGSLEVHHIQRVADIIKLENIHKIEDIKSDSFLWEEENCRTYCIKCHCKIDERRGRFAGIPVKIICEIKSNER